MWQLTFDCIRELKVKQADVDEPLKECAVNGFEWFSGGKQRREEKSDVELDANVCRSRPSDCRGALRLASVSF